MPSAICRATATAPGSASCWQRDRIVGVDINPDKRSYAEHFGMTDFINPKEVADVVATIVEMLDGGADYSFDCTAASTAIIPPPITRILLDWVSSL